MRSATVLMIRKKYTMGEHYMHAEINSQVIERGICEAGYLKKPTVLVNHSLSLKKVYRTLCDHTYSTFLYDTAS